jgi:DNA-directed RNA polymerase subunit H
VAEGSNPFEPVCCSLRPFCCSFLEVVYVTTKFTVQDHDLVPKHALLSPQECEAVLKRYGIDAPQLPKIHVSDPAAKEIEAKVGDIIKVVRKSPTAKESVFYRLVID